MKFLVAWTTRSGGSSADTERDLRRGLEVFSNWSLPEGQTFHAFLQRADGNGGYALVETDSATGLLDGTSKFAPWFEFQVTPVVDMTDAVAVFNAAIECHDSIKSARCSTRGVPGNRRGSFGEWEVLDLARRHPPEHRRSCGSSTRCR